MERNSVHSGTALSLAVALILGACARPPAPDADRTTDAAVTSVAPASPEATPVSASSGAEQKTLQDYLAAWNAHESQRAAALLTDDSEFFDSAFAGRQVGRAAIEEKAINVFLRGMPDLHWEMRSEPVVSDHAIAFEWTLSGTNTGTWGGIPATRQKISLKGVSIMRFREGRISYQSMVYDSATLNRQLGL